MRLAGGFTMKKTQALFTASRMFSGCVALALFATCLNGCLVPPMANVQSARCMDKKQKRIVPYATTVAQTPGVAIDVSARDHVANDFGVLLGFGAGRDSEFQIRFDRIHYTNSRSGYNYTSMGPKFGVVEDVFSILVPVGMYWEGAAFAFESLQFEPGAILTLPVNTHLEINTAGKLILPLNVGAPTWYIANLGVSISTDVDRWALLPEIGVAWANDENADGLLMTYGLAIAFYPRSDG